jgi:hypothetical protein
MKKYPPFLLLLLPIFAWLTNSDGLVPQLTKGYSLSVHQFYTADGGATASSTVVWADVLSDDFWETEEEDDHGTQRSPRYREGIRRAVPSMGCLPQSLAHQRSGPLREKLFLHYRRLKIFC